MIIIEKKDPVVEYTCPKCGSRLGLEKGDIKWYTDMGGDRAPYIKCPVCGATPDVEGLKDIWKLL